MDDLYNDEHDEDDLPTSSVTRFAPPLSKRVSNDRQDQVDNNLLDRFNRSVTPNKSMESWEHLYQTSLRSIEDDDDDDVDQRIPTRRQETAPAFLPSPRSYPLEERTSENHHEEEGSYSTVYEQPIDSSQNKSKWPIRLPQLLHGTIGPDRQKRDIVRRHTTDIVFQQPKLRNQDIFLTSPSLMSNGTEVRTPINPLVKQLRQKFDRMAASSATALDPRLPQQTFGRPTKLRRVTSLTGRGLTNDTDQWLSKRPSPMLPVRPSPNISTTPSLPVRSNSSSSLNSQQTMPYERAYRSKQGPPVSYPKQYFPPPSTTSIVKQLIGDGATLVYDSSLEPKASAGNSSSSSNAPPLSIAQRGEQLKKISPGLNGRPLRVDSSESDYSTINPLTRTEPKSSNNVLQREPRRDPVVDDDEDEEGEYYAVYGADD